LGEETLGWGKGFWKFPGGPLPHIKNRERSLKNRRSLPKHKGGGFSPPTGGFFRAKKISPPRRRKKRGFSLRYLRKGALEEGGFSKKGGLSLWGMSMKSRDLILGLHHIRGGVV